jgi:hypothetical protein
VPPEDVDPSRIELVREAAKASAIELELAATAAFLADAGSRDPWGDAARFKPDKAQSGRLENAKVSVSPAWANRHAASAASYRAIGTREGTLMDRLRRAVVLSDLIAMVRSR